MEPELTEKVVSVALKARIDEKDDSASGLLSWNDVVVMLEASSLDLRNSFDIFAAFVFDKTRNKYG